MMAIANSINQYYQGDRSENLLLTLVSHLNTPKKILEQLANSDNSEVAEAASLHISLAGEVKDNWYELAERIISQKDLGQNDLLICELIDFAVVPDYFISQWIPWRKIVRNIENPDIPAFWSDRLLSRLADNCKVEARMWVAASEHTPIQVLKKLALDDDLKVRTIVSLQPTFCIEWLDCIKDKFIANNHELISHQSLVDYLEDYYKPLYKNCLKLFTQNKNVDLDLRIRVIKHDFTPASVVRELANDEEAEIRKAVAQNSNTSLDVLERLANDSDDSVRKAVASSSMTPKSVRQKLAKDCNPSVRQAVNEKQYFYGDAKDKTYFEGIKRIQRRDNRSHFGLVNRLKQKDYDEWSEQYNRYSNVPEKWRINSSLITSKSLQYKFIHKIAEDRTPQTKEYRQVLAESKDTPVEILEKLVTSPEINIRYRLAKRSELKQDVINLLWQKLINDPEQNKIFIESKDFFNTYLRVNLKIEPEVLPDTLTDYVKGNNLFAKFIALSHPLLSNDLFHSIVKSTSWLERYALTQNPKLPDRIREFLSQDANKIVRAAARCKDKILHFSLNKIVSELKPSNQNLLSTLKVLTKELWNLVNDPECWEKRRDFEVTLWEDKKQFSFIDFLNAHKILCYTNISELLKSPQEQTVGKYVKVENEAPGEFKDTWIEPFIDEEPIERCQFLLNWLQTDLKFVEIYRIVFRKRDLFQILIGQTQKGEWVGTTVDLILKDYRQPSKDSLTYNLGWFIRQLEILIEDIDFSDGLCDRDLLKTNDWQIDNNKNNLIKKLLVFANFVATTEFNYSNSSYDKITRFLESSLVNIESYRIGEKYSRYWYYCEDYIWGMTPDRGWLILKEMKSG